jgi:hypothetical protein
MFLFFVLLSLASRCAIFGTHKQFAIYSGIFIVPQYFPLWDKERVGKRFFSYWQVSDPKKENCL